MMTDQQAYKTIAGRAAEMAKDEEIIKLVRNKFGKNRAAAKRYVYKLAAATLFGAKQEQENDNQQQ
jgi:hypothetical protein